MQKPGAKTWGARLEATVLSRSRLPTVPLRTPTPGPTPTI